MVFSKEQLKTLSAWEEHFRTAVYKNWSRNPGRAGLLVIWEIYTKTTGDRRRFNDNCSNCILSLLQDCGKVYFKDIEELKMEESSTKEVKVSQEAKKVVRKASVKTAKKTK